MKIMRKWTVTILSVMLIIILQKTNVFAGDLQIGDYISLGKYEGEPIVWRYVADDENGKLMLSDKILTFKTFHSRYSKDPYKSVFGSTYWGSSDIRTWLNSSENAENIKWILDGNPESKTYIGEDGLLSNFSSSQKNVIKTVMLGTRLPIFESYIEEIRSEKIFLLSTEQCISIEENKDILGYYLHSEVGFTNHAQAQYNSQEEYDYYRTSWFTRTPCEIMGNPRDQQILPKVNVVPATGNTVDMTVPPYSYWLDGNYQEYASFVCGIRPAFYLNEEMGQILSGSGTKEDPYVVDGGDIPERFKENGLYGYKDRNGNVVIEAKYAKATQFSDGAALVALPENASKWSYIDMDGNLLFEKSFYASNKFKNGYALVLVSDEPTYRYIDKTGEWANDLIFEDAMDFDGGYALVKMNGKWGAVDMKFNFVVPCECETKEEAEQRIMR